MIVAFDMAGCFADTTQTVSCPEEKFGNGSNTMGTTIRKFATDETGATAIEYGLIALGIAIAIVASVEALGISVSNIFVEVSTGF